MKKCENCGKLVFACCGNEPGDYCDKCEKEGKGRDETGGGMPLQR